MPRVIYAAGLAVGEAAAFPLGRMAAVVAAMALAAAAVAIVAAAPATIAQTDGSGAIAGASDEFNILLAETAADVFGRTLDEITEGVGAGVLPPFGGAGGTGQDVQGADAGGAGGSLRMTARATARTSAAPMAGGGGPASMAAGGGRTRGGAPL